MEELAEQIMAANPDIKILFLTSAQLNYANTDVNSWFPQCDGYVAISSDSGTGKLFITVFSRTDYSITYKRKIDKSFKKSFNKMSDTFFSYFNPDKTQSGLSFSSADEAEQFAIQLESAQKKKNKLHKILHIGNKQKQIPPAQNPSDARVVQPEQTLQRGNSVIQPRAKELISNDLLKEALERVKRTPSSNPKSYSQSMYIKNENINILANLKNDDFEMPPPPAVKPPPPNERPPSHYRRIPKIDLSTITLPQNDESDNDLNEDVLKTIQTNPLNPSPSIIEMDPFTELKSVLAKRNALKAQNNL